MSEEFETQQSARRSEPSQTLSKIKILLLVGTTALVLAIIGVVAVRIFTPANSDAEVTCDDATLITVDPAYSATFQQLGKDYVASKKAKCPPVKVQVMASSRVAREGLGKAKAWIPEDGTWQGMATGAAAGLASAKPTVVARTHLVLATTKEAREALTGKLDAETLNDLITMKKTWADYNKPQWGNFKLVIANPEISASGALGFRAMASQVSGGQEPAENAMKGTPQQLAMTETEHRVVQQTSDSSEVLNNLEANPLDATAREKVGPRFGLSTEMAALQAISGEKQKDLKADYLRDGKVGLEIPIIMPAPDSRVEEFTKWLQSEAGKKAIAKQGFRCEGHTPSAEKIKDLGLGQPQPIEPGKPQDRDQGSQWWNKFHHRESLLFVLDMSGSMNQIASGGEPVSEIVKKVVLDSWNTWPPGTANGVITFTDVAGKTQVNTIVPLQRDTSEDWATNKQKYEQQIKTLKGSGGTPLYQGIAEAFDHNKNNYQQGYRNRIIVLTDGRDQGPYGSTTYAQLLAKLPKTASKEEPITFAFVAVGPDADFNSLKRIADQTQGNAIWVKEPKQMQNALQQLLYG